MPITRDSIPVTLAAFSNIVSSPKKNRSSADAEKSFVTRSRTALRLNTIDAAFQGNGCSGKVAVARADAVNLRRNVIPQPPSEELIEKPSILSPRANGRELYDNIAGVRH